VRPVRKLELVETIWVEWNVSIRRACAVFLVDTSTYHYRARRPGLADLEQRIRDIC